MRYYGNIRNNAYFIPKTYALEDMIPYRSVWMGFALLWVVWLHSKLFLPDTNMIFKVLNVIKGHGYGGVDICLFASGLGCYYSLTRDGDLVSFLKRRIKRIVPSMWLYIPFWDLFVYYVDAGIRPQTVLGNFFCIEFLTTYEREVQWYVDSLWVFYLVIPYVVLLYNKQKTSICFGLVLLSIVFAIPFIKFHGISVFGRIAMRMPIFLLGALVGKLCRAGVVINKIHIAVLIFLGIIGIPMMGMIEWLRGGGTEKTYLPFFFMVPAICLILSLASYRFRNSIVCRSLDICGKNSLEILLVHQFVLNVFEVFIGYRSWIWIAFNMMLIIPSVWIFTKIRDKLVCFFTNKVKHRWQQRI